MKKEQRKSMRNLSYGEDLHKAVLDGDVAEVRRLAQLGADLESSNDYGQTPLGKAASDNDAEVVRVLLECGSDPDRRGYEGGTPLENAVRATRYEALIAILEYGEAQAREAHTVQALHKAAEAGEVKLVTLLLDRGADINGLDEYGLTPLMTAIGTRDEPPRLSKEPRQVARLLVKRGADVHIIVGFGYSAGLTALHCAADREDMTLVRLLQKAGAQTTLPIASMLGDAKTVRLLLEQGETINQQGFEGCTPLFYAAEHGHGEIIQLLMERGADPFLKGKWTRSPLAIATIGGHTAAAAALLRHGADKEKETDILNIAAVEGYVDIVALLLQYGWDINGMNADSDAYADLYLTPLMEAAVGDQPEIVRLLIAHGADIDLQNRYGYTALLCAAQHGSLEAGRVLLEAGADIRLQSENGMTALDEARGNENSELANLLRSAQS